MIFFFILNKIWWILKIEMREQLHRESWDSWRKTDGLLDEIITTIKECFSSCAQCLKIYKFILINMDEFSVWHFQSRNAFSPSLRYQCSVWSSDKKQMNTSKRKLALLYCIYNSLLWTSLPKRQCKSPKAFQGHSRRYGRGSLCPRHFIDCFWPYGVPGRSLCVWRNDFSDSGVVSFSVFVCSWTYPFYDGDRR